MGLHSTVEMNFFIVTAALLLAIIGNTVAQEAPEAPEATEAPAAPENINTIVKYTGPGGFEIGNRANFGCYFKANSTMEYIGAWQMEGSQQLAKVTKDNAFVYTTAPKDIRERFYWDTDAYTELQRGQLDANIDSVKIGDDTDFSCIIESGETSIGISFQLKVFSQPQVFTHDRLIEFALEKEENGTVTPIGEVTVASCKAHSVYPIPRSFKFVVNDDKDNFIEVPSSEFVIERQPDKTYDVSADLKITPTLSDHLKTYRCVVIMDVMHNFPVNDRPRVAEAMNASHALWIHHPTTETTLTISPNPVNERKQVTMVCDTDGFPIKTMEILRIHDGGVEETLAFENTTRTITNSITYKHRATKDMTGTYGCKVVTEGGEISKLKTLDVHWHEPNIKVLDRSGSNIAGSTVEGGDSIVLNCTQKGYQPPTLTWYDSKRNVLRSGKQSAVLKWINPKSDKTGRYFCSSSSPGVEEVSVQVNVDKLCLPKIEKAVSQLEDGTPTLAVMCKTQGSPACNMELTSDVAMNVEPIEEASANLMTLTYKGIEAVGSEVTFRCIGRNRQGNFNVSVVVDDPEIVNIPQKAGGVSPGVVVIIILLVTLVVIGIPYAYYRCCRKSDDSGHVKGNQLDSVEVEKLEAVEQTRA